MSEQDFREIANRVTAMFDALEVTKVVCIDDRIPGGASIEDAIVAAQSLPSETVSSLFPEMAESVSEDADVLATTVRQILESLDASAKVERCDAVLVAANTSDDAALEDVEAVSMLSNILPEDRLLCLSPSQWGTQKDALLQTSIETRTLFLFDRDLSAAGGDPNGGIQHISSLVNDEAAKNCLFGLITHTVSPESREQLWLEWSEAYTIPADRFVVIPKSVLAAPSDALIHALKFAILSPDFSLMKQEVRKVIDEAARVAAQRVESVRVYDLDDIVFHVAGKEGLWEPDMLFRLHGCFQRKEALRLAHQGGALERIAGRLRGVSSIPSNHVDPTFLSNSWSLQRAELYDAADEVNLFHLPIELGDIFEKVSSNSRKKYVLLAQPCDLMVRSNGKRHPDVTRVALAELVCSSDAPAYSEELPCFDVECSSRWFVKLKCPMYVSVDVLDLTVFNEDGISRITLQKALSCQLRPPWQARYAEMSKRCAKWVRRGDVVQARAGDSNELKAFKESLRGRVHEVLLQEGLFKGEMSHGPDGDTLTFDCKRVGRISRPRALGLLLSYTSTMARPAYDTPFVTPGVLNDSETTVLASESQPSHALD